MQEQYTLSFSKSIASEIIQKYEPIEEGMLVLESFIKYLYANFLLIEISNSNLVRSAFFWVILYIDSYNFVTYSVPTF